MLVLVTSLLLANGASAQRREKVLVIAQAGDIGNIDNQQRSGAAKNALIHLYDWQWLRYGVREVGGVKVSDTTKLLPGIFESWKIEKLPNGRVKYTYKLRKGVKFHSGNIVTAHDLRWTVARRAALGLDVFFRSYCQWYREDENSNYAEDDYTYVMVTRRQMPLCLDQWTLFTYYDSKYILDKAPADQKDDWYRPWVAKNPAGSGPYRLTSWDPGVELVMERFEGYWGERPKIDKLIWRIVPDTSTRLLLLRRGAVDIALDIPLKDLLALQGAPGVKVLFAPSSNRVLAVFGVKIPPYNDVRVRKALAFAFPYVQVLQHVYKGKAERLTSVFAPLVPYAPKEPFYRTDLGKAKKLLQEAGIKPGYQFPLFYSAASPEHEEIAVLFQAKLREIGYNLELNRVTPGEFARKEREHEMPFYINQVLYWISDPSYYLGQSYVSWSAVNFAAFASKDFDALARQLDVELDPAKRKALSEKGVRMISRDEVVDLYIAVVPFAMAMRDNIVGYVVQNTELHHFWQVDKRD